MKSKGEGKVAVKKSSGMGMGIRVLCGVAEWSKGSAREKKGALWRRRGGVR